MSVGLDIGSTHLRCVRLRDERLMGRAALASFTPLPDAPEYRALLEAGRIPFAVCDGALTIVGDNATEYSMLFHVRPQSLMPHGRLPTNDPVARQSLAALVDALLGEPDQPGEICSVTLPGGESFRSLATSSELEFFSRLIRLRGFSPQVLSAGLSVVLAELSRHSFTGLGLSFGASTSELVVAHRGMELVMCSVPQGGNWLDEQIAKEFGDTLLDEAGEPILDLAKAANRRHSFEGQLNVPTSNEERFLASLHRDLLYALIRSGTFTLAGLPHALEIPQPLPLVAVGGVTRIAGFEGLLRQALDMARFPLAIHEIRFANSHDFTIARGCLINAQLETDARTAQAHAA
ncbi:MAG: cell division FtsA domain-containing protein [Planctomycetaceae bacterium]|nr:cell division FtsA domain-containing protein [Planctomycetaceae bacterium]